ncbi:MAG: hypothetical protein IJ449_11580 [Clostridia bacterium]|nr:hypothetical protein [Clostridia bacterium]
MSGGTRLFHVSEEPDIPIFHPRIPKRADLDPNIGLVWAVDEARLPNFLTPRDCPRVTYHVGEETTDDDRKRFFSSDHVRHCVIIEHGWFSVMRNTTLYLYEFDPAEFTLQDAVAGYYVARTPQTPIAVHRIDDLPAALIERGVEVRITDNLRRIAEDVKASTLNWSLCRMRNAK